MRDFEAQLIHDMRNAASVIRGAAETLHLSHSAMPDSSVDDLTAMLARRSDMLVRLLEDLSTMHALDRGDLSIELQPVDLADTFRDVVAEHQDRLGDPIKVEIGADALVLGDPFRIVQILDNLLSNAARYGGGQVGVRAWRDEGVVRIAVSDDGPGVPDEIVSSLFDPYSRGTGSQQLGGSGLGLAIVHQLCQALGGGISYDASEGTTFTASLPAVPRTPERLGADAAKAGHTVSFWVDDASLADAVTNYVASGLVAGAGVVIAVTAEHRHLVEERLITLGFDVPAAIAVGQFLPLDADELRCALEVNGHVDPSRFNDTIGATIQGVADRWQTFRVFGEIVDLYWRDGAGQLALELEKCWNRLRAQVDFPLYCGYQVSVGQDRVCDCHDAVLVA